MHGTAYLSRSGHPSTGEVGLKTTAHTAPCASAPCTARARLSKAAQPAHNVPLSPLVRFLFSFLMFNSLLFLKNIFILSILLILFNIFIASFLCTLFHFYNFFQFNITSVLILIFLREHFHYFWYYYLFSTFVSFFISFPNFYSFFSFKV